MATLSSVTSSLAGLTYNDVDLVDVTVSSSNGTYTVTGTLINHAGEGKEPFSVANAANNVVAVKPQAFGGSLAEYYQVIGFDSNQVLLQGLDNSQKPFVPPSYTVLSNPPLTTTGAVFGTTGNFTPPTVPCFMSGTRILTARGQVAVEDLIVGDIAITASGRESAIRWIGNRTLAPATHRQPDQVQPVRVSAGAFAERMPLADLWLSPGHAVFADGVLIPVSFLVNGASIVQVPVESVTYWHVELETHDVLLAEGLPAESYLDTGNRTAFAGGGAFLELFPNFAAQPEKNGCAPLVVDGPALVAVRDRLIARLPALGHVPAETEALQMLADGAPVALTVEGNTLRATLPPGTRTLRLASSSMMPCQNDPRSGDTRRLGVAITGLRLGDADALSTLALDDATLTEGFHPVERNAGTAWRWTNGSALISFETETSVVEIDLLVDSRPARRALRRAS